MGQRSSTMLATLLTLVLLVPAVALASTFDGNPSTTERVDAADPTDAAIQLSNVRFADGAASHAVLSRDDTFPDSLAGSALTAAGPLLFTRTASLTPSTRAEIQRVVPGGGTVYLLGGPVAIDPAVESAVQGMGYQTKRLWGDTRVETSVAVADEVRRLFPAVTRAAVARAFGTRTAAWADSITGGAYAAEAGLPILVTRTEALHPAVDAWLKANTPSETVLLGGEAALSAAVESAVANSRRVWGAARDGTAAEIAKQLWGVTASGNRKFVIVNGFHEDTWAYGLAAAGLAADQDAPILMINVDNVPDSTRTLITGCDTPQVDLTVMGSTAVVAAERVAEMDAVDGIDCGGGGGGGGGTVDATQIKHTQQSRSTVDDTNSQLAPLAGDAVIFATQSSGTFSASGTRSASGIPEGAVTTGTITQQSDGSYTYSSQPTDRLVVKFADGTTIEFVIRSLECDCEYNSGSDIMSSAHDVDFDAMSPGAYDVSFHSINTQAGQRQGTFTGTAVFDGITYTYDLQWAGSWVYEAGSLSKYETDDTVSGTITSSRMALNASYRTRFKLFASGDGAVFDWDRWDESSLTIDGVSYQYAGPAHIQTSFRDGKATGLDDPNAWGADGALLRNGAAWGQLQMRDAGLDIVAEVVTPDGTFEIGRWAKGF